MSNYFNEWRESWPVAFIVAVLLGINVAVAGLFGAVLSYVIDMMSPTAIGEENRYLFWLGGIALAVIFPVGLNRAMRDYYRKEIDDEIAAAQRDAYQRGRGDAEVDAADDAAAATRR